MCGVDLQFSVRGFVLVFNFVYSAVEQLERLVFDLSLRTMESISHFNSLLATHLCATESQMLGIALGAFVHD